MLALALALNLTPPLSHLALSRRPLERELEIATAFLSAQAGVTRVWLFGSAAKGRRLDWRSDLDFAVEGLSASALPGAWSELDARLSYPVDLVRWEEASEDLRAQIRAWGKVLYET